MAEELKRKKNEWKLKNSQKIIKKFENFRKDSKKKKTKQNFKKWREI